MSPESSGKILMTPEEAKLLTAFVYSYCGLSFDQSNTFLLESRLQNRLKTHRFESFMQYYRYLLFHPDRSTEINEMVDVLTTNETYFFREKKQLDAFSQEILPELARDRAGSRQIRIWSAGCSTGEEPYTLAILIKESGLFEGWHVDLMGTDISHRVLKSARRAIYSGSSFRVTEEGYIRKYFTPAGDGKSQLCEEIRSLVHFGHLNLLDQNMLGLIGECDVVFCRNVIIYFDQEAKVKVVGSFHRKIRPGGYLLLGHSESLMNISTAFRLRHLKNDMVYQKAEEER